MVEIPFGWMLFLACVAILGTLGNLLIMGSVAVSKRLRRRSNAFIVNLAFADIVVTCYIMPIGLATSHYRENPFNETVCDVNAFLIITTCGVSTQSLMLVALERYFHICKSKYYHSVFRPSLIALYVAFTWVYSAAWGFQGWTGWTRYAYGEDVYVCLLDGPYSLSYDICLVTFGMLLPLAVLGFSYTCIFREVHRSNVRLAAHRRRYGLNNSSQDSLYITERNIKREFRFVMTLFAIVVAFGMLWLPASIVLPMSGVWEDMPRTFYTVAVWLAFCNSCVNSFIYGILNKNFRTGYIDIIHKMFCCKGSARKCNCNEALLNAREDTLSRSTATSRLGSSRSPASSRSLRLHTSRVNSMTSNPLYYDGSSPDMNCHPNAILEEGPFPVASPVCRSPLNGDPAPNFTDVDTDINDVDSVSDILQVTQMEGLERTEPVVPVEVANSQTFDTKM